jgi:hypothetical protein
MSGQIAHASFGASNSKRRMACPGSLKAEERFPDTSSPFAELGTAAHELGEHCLENNLLDVSETIGGTFYDHVVDDNMAGAVQTYVDFVKKIEAEEAPALLRLEQRFSLEDLDPPMPMFGTSDCTIYGKSSANLWIIDYKHGQGVAVDVEDNAQLKYYALGAVLKIGNKAPINQVHTAIVQPRAMHRDGPIRTHSYTKDEILDFGTDLIDAAHAALKPDAPLVAGDHCKFCKAAGVCPALRSNALAVAQDDFGAVRSVDDLTPEEIASYMMRIPLVEEWIKSLRRHANSLLEAGTPVPGYKLVEKRPTRKWKTQDAVLEWAASEELEDDEIFEKKIKSPAQMEKVVGKKNVPADLIMSVSTGLSMVEDTDSRPPVAMLASDEFNVNE